jgi:biopolymer transport protein ExbD
MRKTRVEEDAGGELNVVPYLDILMNLILFMLLSMTGLATLGTAPGRAERSGETNAPSLALVLTVREDVYLLEGAGLEPRVLAREPQLLTAALRDVKQLHPSERSIVVRAQGSVDYATLVATLDAARETDDRAALFPDPVLAF